ncbi:hypothetical protein [Sphingomonas sp.]|uniref:hypothetical protein n=1 Tax=Sphingomonas sp. TaxID=28214 RepID=UPI002614F025|nr:hypothetical protein [Sphingomonas sp.]MDF2603052.1 hypothetical protein [Sphingomonas sp.]
MADTSELDALIVRNISDVEAALLRAFEIGDEVIEEIGNVLRSMLGDAWEVIVDGKDDTPIRFARRGWLGGNTPVLARSYHISLTGKEGPSGDTDQSWLMTLLGNGPKGSSAVFYLWSDKFYTKRRWKKLLDDKADRIKKLLDAGFRQDENQWLYLPLLIDSEELANGLEVGDLSRAMAPVSEAISIIQAVVPEIEALIERDRTFD